MPSILTPEHEAMATRTLDQLIQYGGSVLDENIARLRETTTSLATGSPYKGVGIDCQHVVQSAWRIVQEHSPGDEVILKGYGCLVIRELERTLPYAQGNDLSYISARIRDIAESIGIDLVPTP